MHDTRILWTLIESISKTTFSRLLLLTDGRLSKVPPSTSSIDIFGPPSQPRPFVIDAADVIVESDDDGDELNDAMIEENENVDQEDDEDLGPGKSGDS